MSAEAGHALFVSVHAAAATVALIAGLLALHTGRGFGLHRASVLVMAAALGPSMAFGWGGFGTAERVAFSALAALACFMVVQAVRAGRIRQAEAAAGRVVRSTPRGLPAVGTGFVQTLGFNVVALVVAGTVVPVLRIGAGTIGVVASVAVSVAVGHVLLERRRAQVAAQLGQQRRVAEEVGTA